MSPDASSPSVGPHITWDDDAKALVCSGDWIVSKNLELILQKVSEFSNSNPSTIDASQIAKLDTAGAFILWKISTHPDKTVNGLLEQKQSLFELVKGESQKISADDEPPKENWLVKLGESTAAHYFVALSLIAFIGELFVFLTKNLAQIGKLQWRSFFSAIFDMGYKALPILALLSALIGVVLCYQTGQQLKVYGANIYIVGLLGVGVLQEFGPLITAIIVVGRTSSALTAKIGSMKINQEIDALRTFGLSPMDYLVVPKILGLWLVMPFLILWADAFGVLGGMIVSKQMLGINFYSFLSTFQKSIELSTLLNGLIKAPVFATIIGSVGCFQGMQVSGSADEVGKRTTQSVVQAIFLIIIADAIFSIILPFQSLS